ncbi:hypothetical protein [Robertkochia solimangrovi]|uniref:hypothetical protein n=1 Tax=Robertkochia solimangrovi TaxID=2213046 RepID=UPI00117E8CB1|nr:hypothetical protein [Robertkochia solimangrovi]TRZ42172.1 hypothetical protein DMZ48_14155 [Robertkochia solimangrovi]
MTEKQIEKIVDSNKVLSDELDKNKYFGFFPAVLITLAFGIPNLPFITDNTTLNPTVKWIGLLSGLLLILLTFLSFNKEKEIKSVITNLDKESNRQIIEKYFCDQNISLTKYSNYYSTLLPSLFYKKGLKLIIIPMNNKILFNLRTIGFAVEGGRIPYSIGKQIQQNKLTEKIRNYAQQGI